MIVRVDLAVSRSRAVIIQDRPSGVYEDVHVESPSVSYVRELPYFHPSRRRIL